MDGLKGMSIKLDSSSIGLLLKYSSTEVVIVFRGVLDGSIQVHGVVIWEVILVDVLFVGYCFFETIKMLFDCIGVLPNR